MSKFYLSMLSFPSLILRTDNDQMEVTVLLSILTTEQQSCRPNTVENKDRTLFISAALMLRSHLWLFLSVWSGCSHCVLKVADTTTVDLEWRQSHITIRLFNPRSHWEKSLLYLIQDHVWKWPEPEFNSPDSVWFLLLTLFWMKSDQNHLWAKQSGNSCLQSDMANHSLSPP